MLNPYWKKEINNIDDDKYNGVSYNMTKQEAMDLSRQIKALNEDIKSIHKDNDPEIERVIKWRDDQINIANNKKARLQEQLLIYYRTNKNQDDNFKFKTPYVNITEYNQTKWNWNDEKEVISSLEDNDETRFIKTEKSINKNDLKKLTKVVGEKVITSDGIVLEGVTVTKEKNTKLKIVGD